jgi:c-di-GMP-binding flagellar brake protein YcgR
MSKNRRHKRVPITGSAFLTLKGQKQIQSFHTLTRDISLSGIGLYSDSYLTDCVDVSLRINFISTDGLLESTLLQGHVVYSRQIEEMYFVGIEFDEELNRKNHPSLFKHVHKVLNSEKN